MSWIWPDYVNRELPLSKAELKSIHREAWRLWAARKSNIALYLSLPVAYLLGVAYASGFAARLASLVGFTGPLHVVARVVAPLAFFVLCFVVGGAVLQRFRFAPCVYEATRTHGHDVCIKCGYWLRGLGEDIERCPECGAQREAMPKETE